MKSHLLVLACLLLAGCGGAGDVQATDPGAEPSAQPGAEAMPTDIPPADGTVATRALGTVLDTGSPELCLGAVAESWPPQCRGIPLRDWDWSSLDGVFERSGDTRWGEFFVAGTFDGTAMTVRQAVPAALHSPVSEPPGPEPDPGDASAGELESMAEELGDLPGVLTVVPTDGRLDVSVVHDDGTLQAWADRTYGPGQVVLESAFVPVG
ncbi:hypothetical protein [Nocardioides donggukensis]|uniref:Uncharacterized protein n=1 Tax=Nocardioides donggukensis TaxID=2774019 RepID=A0A927Q3E8_9ACTN|nr:hypothetical protein [Nocardioides donggukensis]MBD8870526.1 hypothetical protein [Nocardioides donggukensis]